LLYTTPSTSRSSSRCCIYLTFLVHLLASFQACVGGFGVGRGDGDGGGGVSRAPPNWQRTPRRPRRCHFCFVCDAVCPPKIVGCCDTHFPPFLSEWPTYRLIVCANAPARLFNNLTAPHHFFAAHRAVRLNSQTLPHAPAGSRPINTRQTDQRPFVCRRRRPFSPAGHSAKRQSLPQSWWSADTPRGQKEQCVCLCVLLCPGLTGDEGIGDATQHHRCGRRP
jgi:hypothetical protein